MTEMLDVICDDATLLAAWSRLQAKDAEDGHLTSAVREFSRDALCNLQALATAVRTQQWQPGPLYMVDTVKTSGGTRTLAVGSVADRVLERAILLAITDRVDAHLMPWSFAYRRGLGVGAAHDALIALRDDGYRYIARCDIEDCFDEIPRTRALLALRRCISDEKVLDLVEALLERKEVGAGQRRDSGRGLPQGSALSPLLCNLYLDAFDRRLAEGGWLALRYADDIAIAAATPDDAEQALLAAAVAVSELGLALNERKSRWRSFDEGVEFLGKRITSRHRAAADGSDRPARRTVFVVEQGSVVRAQGDRLRVTQDRRTVLRTSMSRVRQVVVEGRVGLTTPFMHRAAEYGIDVVILDDDHTWVSRLEHPFGGDPQTRLQQYRSCDNRDDALAIARGFVAGKTMNMRTHLVRLRRSGLGTIELDEAVAGLAQDHLRALDARANAILMGVEGAATRRYFSALRRLLPEEWGFEGRRHRPPPDPVNAMLSYLYTLLALEAVAAVAAAGLDPQHGFLHLPRRGRASLALDLMEEFRPLIVDQVVMRLVLDGRVHPSGFSVSADGGWRMHDTVKRRLLSSYERRMLTLTTHPDSSGRLSYRSALHAQSRHLTDRVLERVLEYRPLPWR